MVRPPVSSLTSVVLTYVSPRMRGAILSAPLALLAVLGCAARAGAQPAGSPAAEADAHCPWGRLANGRGVLVRCLSEGEARRLMAVAPPPADATEAPVAAGGAPSPPRPATASKAGAARAPAGPAAAPSTAPVPAAPGDAGGRSGVPAVPPPGAGAGVAPAVAPPQAVTGVEPAGDPALTVEISEPAADAGSLPEAVRSLAKANDRFRECVQKNGGVAGERGEVELRFLVRGRGRAEGVSVKKWKGLTEGAARCVADVVDRRFVGYPEEPIVGVTLTLSFGKKKL